MPSLLFWFAIAAVIGAASYQVGLFDWPAFEETTLEPQLYILMASICSKDIPGNVERLLKGTHDAIDSVAKERLNPPAAAYGAPKGADSLSVGLYFDDPRKSEHPRWGLGWAIQVENDEDFKQIQSEVAQASMLEEPIRAVKIGGGSKVLRGRIPWRIALTPAIAPVLHWGRAFNAYKQGGYISTSGREGDDGSIACEIYVTGPNDSMEYIDYVVLMGDTTEIFDSVFPPQQQHTTSTTNTTVAMN